MNTTIELVLELVGGVILLLTAGYVLSLISGYDEYYDKMLYDNKDASHKIKKKKQNVI
ncbi:MAG: hypothetical protein PHT07_02860 [Paludibacter sp.]|nr:hypothetical protein [Paludibacter sp.]